MRSGITERRIRDYKRNGTTSLFAAPDVVAGFVTGKCCKRHRSKEFPDFLKEVNVRVLRGTDVHIIVDNCVPPQDRRRRGMAGEATALACLLHADPGLADRSGRAPIHRIEAKTAATGRPYLHKATRNGYPRLHRKAQPRHETLLVDEIR